MVHTTVAGPMAFVCSYHFPSHPDKHQLFMDPQAMQAWRDYIKMKTAIDYWTGNRLTGACCSVQRHVYILAPLQHLPSRSLPQLPPQPYPAEAMDSRRFTTPLYPIPIRIPTCTPIPTLQTPWPPGAATRCVSAPCVPPPAAWPPAGATCWPPPPSADGRTTPRSAGALRRCVQRVCGPCTAEPRP